MTHPTVFELRARQGYEAVAPEFDERRVTTRYFHALSFPSFERFLHRLPSGCRALEVGTGRGALTEVLVRFGLELSVLDISRAMLQRHALGQDLPRIQGSALRLPIRSGALHVVLGSLIDAFVHRELFAEISRVLAPGGRFAFSTPSAEFGTALRDPHSVAETRFGLSDGSSVAVPSFLFEPSELYDLASGTGLSLEVACLSAAAASDAAVPPDVRTAASVQADVPLLYFLSGTAVQ